MRDNLLRKAWYCYLIYFLLLLKCFCNAVSLFYGHANKVHCCCCCYMNYLPPVTNETKSRCPCVLNKRQCVTKCRCLNCEYREKNHEKISCPCGESDKKPELQNAAKTACTDVDGQRWQNVVAVRMDKLVPLFFHTRNVEMFMVKEKHGMAGSITHRRRKITSSPPPF